MARFTAPFRLVHCFMLRQKALLQNSPESNTRPAGGLELGGRREGIGEEEGSRSRNIISALH